VTRRPGHWAPAPAAAAARRQRDQRTPISHLG
jgi:hypothetical protein